MNFFILFICGRYIGSRGAFVISFVNFMFAFLYSAWLGYQVFILKCISVVYLWTFLFFMHGNVFFSLQCDGLSLVMFVVVLLVSGLVHCYSTSYMRADPYIVTFLSFLSLFTFFMLVLVTSVNLIQLFFGWEGIGLCSYLLIGFWSTRLQANKSALKAIVFNRVGDVFFFIGLGLTFTYFYSFNLDIIFPSAEFLVGACMTLWGVALPVIDIICFCFTIAAIAKSAQLGLHMWLPDAMEGPTPVSALIHAATMVTAGIFLLNRLSFLLVNSTYVLNIIVVLGSLTIVYAASCALYQNDIKKVIAYSTCSQLGYMFLACGLLAFNLSFFHLVTHALFKALLFLGAGSVIHSLLGEQDIRRMGSLHKFLPITYISIAIGSLALMGLPFLSGFYSKEAIIFKTMYPNSVFIFACGCALLGAVFTSIYSIRLLVSVFFGVPSVFRVTMLQLHESDLGILIPLIVLSVLSIVSGFILQDLFIGFGTNSLSPVIHESTTWLFGLPYRSLFLVFFVVTLFFFLFTSVYWSSPIMYTGFAVRSTLLWFLTNKWYFDYLIGYLSSEGYSMTYGVFKVVDRSVDATGLWLLFLKVYDAKLWVQKYSLFDQVYMNIYAVYSLVLLSLLILQYS